MASLRTQAASRLLRGAAAPRTALPLTLRRFESGLVQTEAPPAVPESRQNQPDYDIVPDKATS
jgi:hypothetical protein